MELRQNGIKKGTQHVIYHWKAYFPGNQKNHVANVALNSYSSPLQKHSPSNNRFFEKFPLYITGKYAYIQALSTHHIINHFCLT